MWAKISQLASKKPPSAAASAQAKNIYGTQHRKAAVRAPVVTLVLHRGPSEAGIGEFESKAVAPLRGKRANDGEDQEEEQEEQEEDEEDEEDDEDAEDDDDGEGGRLTARAMQELTRRAVSTCIVDAVVFGFCFGNVPSTFSSSSDFGVWFDSSGCWLLVLLLCVQRPRRRRSQSSSKLRRKRMTRRMKMMTLLLARNAEAWLLTLAKTALLLLRLQFLLFLLLLLRRLQ